MILINLIILTLTICIDSFLLCLLSKNKRKRDYLLIPLIFSFFQTSFLLTGYFFGNFIEESLRQHIKYVIFIIFSTMGLKLVIDTLINKGKEKTCQLTLKSTFLQAIITSFDSIFLGIPFAFKDISIITLISTTSVTTITACLLGLLLMNKIKESYEDKISIIGAITLFIFAFKSLI